MLGVLNTLPAKSPMCIVEYEGLLVRPETECARIVEFLKGLPACESSLTGVESMVAAARQSLQHHSSGTDLTGFYGATAAQARLYEELRQAAQDRLDSRKIATYRPMETTLEYLALQNTAMQADENRRSVERLRGSVSYRIGRAVTWFPRLFTEH